MGAEATYIALLIDDVYTHGHTTFYSLQTLQSAPKVRMFEITAKTYVLHHQTIQQHLQIRQNLLQLSIT